MHIELRHGTGYIVFGKVTVISVVKCSLSSNDLYAHVHKNSTGTPFLCLLLTRINNANNVVHNNCHRCCQFSDFVARSGEFLRFPSNKICS